MEKKYTRRDVLQLASLLMSGESIWESFAYASYLQEQRQRSIFFDERDNIYYQIHTVQMSAQERQKPLYLVFLSDLHVVEQGKNGFDHEKLVRLVNNTNQIMSTLTPEGWHLVLGGDLHNHSETQPFNFYPQTPASTWQKTHEILSGLATTSRHFVLGNHENRHSQVNQISGHLQTQGFMRLDDSSHAIDLDGFRLFGLPDMTTIPYDQEALLNISRQVNDGSTNILISHNPLVFDSLGIFVSTLALAGHMHGGFFARRGLLQRSANSLVLNRPGYTSRFTDGEYDFPHQRSKVIVNNGCGDHPSKGIIPRTSAQTMKIIKIT